MNITVIGGGTGTSSVLKGLKKYKELNINVIVTMMDDGGSNQVIREVFGLLPVSDIRKSILALSKKDDDKLKEVLEYRFDSGKNLKGHTVGNLTLVALSKLLNSEEKSIQELSDILEVQGHVIPVTDKMCKLVAEYDNGKIRHGEHSIDEPRNFSNERITHIYTKPTVKASKRAIKAIKESDYIILGPGDLYTTTIANLLVLGIPKAINESKAKLIYISNLMTKKGQTRHLTASGLLNEVSTYAQRVPDHVLINNSPIPEKILRKYKKEKPIPDDVSDNQAYKVIRKDLIEKEERKRQKGDDLVRSLIRHDCDKIGVVLKNIFDGKT